MLATLLPCEFKIVAYKKSLKTIILNTCSQIQDLANNSEIENVQNKNCATISGYTVIFIQETDGPKVYEPRREKTRLRGFQPGSTHTGPYILRKSLEASNSGFRKKRNCTIRVAKTKVLISCAVTAQLICAFVFT